MHMPSPFLRGIKIMALLIIMAFVTGYVVGMLHLTVWIDNGLSSVYRRRRK